MKLEQLHTGKSPSVAASGSTVGALNERLSDTQRYGIGFAGEWLAFHRLKRRYGAAFTEQCWVSGYRSVVFGGEGNDELGYDFIVPGARGEIMYEEVTVVIAEKNNGRGWVIWLGEQP